MDKLNLTEQSQLRRLLKKIAAADASSDEALAAARREDERLRAERDQQEAALRAESDRLAAEEAAAAERLAQLRSALDRVTSELDEVVSRRRNAVMLEEGKLSRAYLVAENERLHRDGAAYQPQPVWLSPYEDDHRICHEAWQAIRRMRSNAVKNLAALAANRTDAKNLEAIFRISLQCDFPELFAPPPAVDTAAIEQQRLNEQRAATALAVVNAGRAARNEPPLTADDVVINFDAYRKDKPHEHHD